MREADAMSDKEYAFDPDRLTREIGEILFRVSEIADSEVERQVIQQLDDKFTEALDKLTCVMREIKNLDGLTREGVRNALSKISSEGFCGLF